MITARKIANALKRAGHERSDYDDIGRTTGFLVEPIGEAFSIRYVINHSAARFLTLEQQGKNTIRSLKAYEAVAKGLGLQVEMMTDTNARPYLHCSVAASKE